jgi:hypothetical protein
MEARTQPDAPAAPSPDGARDRPPLVRHPGRVLTVVATVAVVVTLGIWVLSTAETETGRARNSPQLPSAVQTASPGPGELARPQATISVDLRDDLIGVLLVDGVEIPEDQLERVVPLGQVSFRPGADREFARFSPGTHRVTVLYWNQRDLRPERPASATWDFRVGA